MRKTASPWLLFQALMLPVVGAAQSSMVALDTTFARVAKQAVHPAVGMIVVHRGRVVYERHGGLADIERQVRASALTRYDLASIAKQFTGYAVAQLVHRGVLDADADVRRYVPELDLGGSAITLRQLLHHTAGLEDTDGLYALSGGREGDPLTHADLVHLLVRQQHLRFAPGSQFAYSNGGYTLLAEVLARRSGAGFVTYTDTAVFRALGMRQSGFLQSPFALVPGRALPYVPNGASGFRLSTSDLYPAAGGLFATMRDMARWMQHLLHPGAAEPAVRLMLSVGRLTSGDTISYGWGIGHGMYRGRPTWQHAGSGPATASHMLLIPSLDFGVVVSVASDVDVNPAQLAFRAADAVVGSQLGPVPPPQRGQRMFLITDAMMREIPVESRGVRVSRAELARFSGTYRNVGGDVLVIRARGDSLELAREGQTPWFPLFPLADGRFMTMPLRRAYRFALPSSGAATHVVQDLGPGAPLADGTPVEFSRVPEPVFTEEAARPYVGLYHSDELGTTYEVARVGNALELVHARHGRLPLTPLGNSRFGVQGGGIVGVTFVPGADGMTALELEARSWGVRVSFRRLAAERNAPAPSRDVDRVDRAPRPADGVLLRER